MLAFHIGNMVLSTHCRYLSEVHYNFNPRQLDEIMTFIHLISKHYGSWETFQCLFHSCYEIPFEVAEITSIMTVHLWTCSPAMSLVYLYIYRIPKSCSVLLYLHLSFMRKNLKMIELFVLPRSDH